LSVEKAESGNQFSILNLLILKLGFARSVSGQTGGRQFLGFSLPAARNRFHPGFIVIRKIIKSGRVTSCAPCSVRPVAGIETPPRNKRGGQPSVTWASPELVMAVVISPALVISPPQLK
jgi:hypothetical protein